MENVWQYFTKMFPKQKLCNFYPCHIVGFGMVFWERLGSVFGNHWKPLFCSEIAPPRVISRLIEG